MSANWVLAMCARCNRPKRQRDSNAGWWQVGPRGRASLERHLCPDCAPSLVMQLETALVADAQGRQQRVVEGVDLERWFRAAQRLREEVGMPGAERNTLLLMLCGEIARYTKGRP